MKLRQLLRPTLAALFCCAASSLSEAEHTSSPRLTLFVDAPGETSSRTLEFMRHELESLLGLSVHRNAWKQGNPRGLLPAEGASVWLKLHGPCQACRREICSKKYGPMGRTWALNGRVQPWMEVECDLVRRMIHRQVLAAGPGNAENLLGRAIARVVAHELYHVYMNTPHHADEVLTRAAFFPEDLTRGGVEFTESCREQIRTAVCGSTRAGAE